MGSNGSELNNGGDTVEIRDDVDNIIDRVQFDNSWGGNREGNNYYSLSRKSIDRPSQDSSNWYNYPYINYTRSNITVYCLSTPLILISEIMYYPCPRDKNGIIHAEIDMEFVEIYNASDKTINIQNWTINGNRITINVRGGFNLSPGSYAIIGGRRSQIDNWYNFGEPFDYLEVEI